jgi:hypothetical protein
MRALIALTGYAPTLLPARIGTQTSDRSLNHHQPLIGRKKLACSEGLARIPGAFPDGEGRATTLWVFAAPLIAIRRHLRRAL